MSGFFIYFFSRGIVKFTLQIIKFRSSQEDWMYECLNDIYDYFILTIYNTITEVSNIINHLFTRILFLEFYHRFCKTLLTVLGSLRYECWDENPLLIFLLFHLPFTLGAYLSHDWHLKMVFALVIYGGELPHYPSLLPQVFFSSHISIFFLVIIRRSQRFPQCLSQGSHGEAQHQNIHKTQCVPHSALPDWREWSGNSSVRRLAISEQKAKHHGPRNLFLSFSG